MAHLIEAVPPSPELAELTSRLLGRLPTWFGIPESNAEYVRSATELPGYVAVGTSDEGSSGADSSTSSTSSGGAGGRSSGSGTGSSQGGGSGGRVGDGVGVLLRRRHFAESAEIHLLAVDPAWHRRGVGRALVAALVADLVADGCRLLQVKTLGPGHPDAGYALTRAFYRAVGFLPLEETRALWSPDDPCLIMVRPL